jgi:hypothetical protein
MGKPSKEAEVVYFLVLSGGAFRGAFQYWVIIHLLKQVTYQAIYGVSVGSVNGIMAAMDKLDLLFDFWDKMDGLSEYLRLRPFYVIGWVFGIVWLLKKLGVRIIGGLYSMAPLGKKLTDEVDLAAIKTPFVAGVVAANSGEYHEMDTRRMKRNQRAVKAVLASSCMAPIMQPPLVHLEQDENKEPEVGFDGGYRLERIHRVSSRDMDDPMEMGLRAIELFEAEVYDGDILQMREAVGGDGEVHLWVPQPLTDKEALLEKEELTGSDLTPIEIPGTSFDASRNTIQGRLRESKRMVERGPFIYTGLDAEC